MVENQTECSKFEEKSVHNLLVGEKCERCEIYQGMCDVYGEVRFRQKNDCKWDKLLKEGKNSIQDEDRKKSGPQVRANLTRWIQ